MNILAITRVRKKDLEKAIVQAAGEPALRICIDIEEDLIAFLREREKHITAAERLIAETTDLEEEERDIADQLCDRVVGGEVFIKDIAIAALGNTSVEQTMWRYDLQHLPQTLKHAGELVRVMLAHLGTKVEVKLIERT